jgi:hypothetical protein
VVALLGALGGSLTAALSIRNLKGTSTPYDVPVALAMLKVPLGAFTAILALVAIRGNFVPGLSNLDSQEQILAYALVFGFAQQALSRLLDQRAQTLLEGLPGGTANEPSPTPSQPSTQTSTPAPATPEPTVEEPPPAPPEVVDAGVTPAGELPEDADVIPAEATMAEVPGDPLPAPDEQPDPAMLPDQEGDVYFEDGQAEVEAGADAPDGVEYPTADKDV